MVALIAYMMLCLFPPKNTLPPIERNILEQRQKEYQATQTLAPPPINFKEEYLELKSDGQKIEVHEGFNPKLFALLILMTPLSWAILFSLIFHNWKILINVTLAELITIFIFMTWAMFFKK